MEDGWRKLKHNMKIIIQLLADITHLLIGYSLMDRISKAKDVFYSRWIMHEFKTCGRNCLFQGFSLLKGAKHIAIGSNLYCGNDVVWEVYDSYQQQLFTPSVVVGNNCSFGDNGHLTCINSITIGNGVRIGRKVFICDNSHGKAEKSELSMPANMRPMYSKGPVVIEDNVWIGEMVCILPNVRIGKGSIIGANAVVTKDVPANALVGGYPARVIKIIE